MTRLGYRLSDPTSRVGLLWNAFLLLALVAIGSFLLGTEVTTNELIVIDNAAAALIGAAIGIGLTPVFHLSERFRRIWSSLVVRAVVIGSVIFRGMALLETGQLASAPVLIGAITIAGGALLARVALYNRLQSAN